MGTKVTFAGKVVKAPWARGSKSEHTAVCVVSDGKPMKLRRAGGNPFVDQELEKLVGKSIKGEGEMLSDSTVLMSSWKEV